MIGCGRGHPVRRARRMGPRGADISVLLLLVVVILSGGCTSGQKGRTEAASGQRIVREFPLEQAVGAEGATELVVSLHRGEITVQARPGGDVRVVGKRVITAASKQHVDEWLQTVKLRVTREGNAVKVEDVWPTGPVAWDGHEAEMRADLRVEVPTGLVAGVVNGVGDTEVLGEFESVKVQAGVGQVAARVTTGPLEVAVGTGSIAFSGQATRVAFESGAGQISVEGELGEGEINCGSGDLVLSIVRCTGRKLRAVTGAGSVRARLTRLPTKALRLTTAAGDIDLAVPLSAAGLNLDARTGTGQVTTAPGLHLREVKRLGNGLGQVLHAVYQGGQCEVTLRTGNGDISLRTLNGDVEGGPGSAFGKQPGR